MDLSATNISYTIAAYAISGICIFALLIFVLIRDRNLAAKIKNLPDKENQ